MSIVSGIATASGLSPLLNAPRDANVDLRAARGDAQQVTVSRLAEDQQRPASVRKVARPVFSPSQSEGLQASVPRRSAELTDNRYVRFVDAVEALRLDYDAASELTADRIADLKAAAEAVFKMGDSVPREVRSYEATPEDAVAEDRAKRAEAADRAEKARAAKAELAALEARERQARAAGETPEAAPKEAYTPPAFETPEPAIPQAAEVPEAAPAIPAGVPDQGSVETDSGAEAAPVETSAAPTPAPKPEAPAEA